MSMRIKGMEKNLLLTCRSANKVEQIKNFKDGLRDTTKRKYYSNYQTEEWEKLDIDCSKRSKNIRKSHSENQMKIPSKGSMPMKESTKMGPISIDDSNENDHKNAHNEERQTKSYSIKYVSDKRYSRLNDYYEKAIGSKESNQTSPGFKRKVDSTNKFILLSLNSPDKSDKYDKRRKPTNHTKLRQLWKNLQHISSYHRKQKIGRLRKYCSRTPTPSTHGKNKSHRNYTENDKNFPQRSKTKEIKSIHWKGARDENTKRSFESESHAPTKSTPEEHNEKSNRIIDKPDGDLSYFLDRKGSHILNKETSSDDVSKIDEKYLKYILLITNKEGLKNNRENIKMGGHEDEGNVSKNKKIVNVLKLKTSQNQLKTKQVPHNTIKVDNQSKDYFIQNRKNLIDHKIESESKPTGESLITDEQTYRKKNFIVVNLSPTKQSDYSKKSRIDHGSKESGPAKAKQNKNNSLEPNSELKNHTPTKPETVTTAPRGEQSKFEFVELWRRNSKKNSQDSLSSHSSIHLTDKQEVSDEDSSDGEYLGIRSYQALKKIVEQEVQKIFKSYKKKEAIENERKESESKSTENTKPVVPLGKKSGTITVNKPQLENKLQSALKQTPVVKDDRGNIKSDRVMDTKINLPPQKEKPLPQFQNLKKQNNEFEKLRVAGRKNSDEINKKLKILSEQESKDVKIPTEILKNWTIMHRLEQAFLALGTPNFQNKNLPLTKPKVIGGKVPKDKVGLDKIRTGTGGSSSGDENKAYKPSADLCKVKIPQKKPDIRKNHSPESDIKQTEQKVKKSKTEKETVKGIKKKDDSDVNDLPRKTIQPSPTKKSLESFNTNIKKPEGILLSKDHKAQVRNRFKPETLSRVPRKALENIDTKSKHKMEKPIQTQEVSEKPIETPVTPQPTKENESDNDVYSDCKVGVFTDPDESSEFSYKLHVSEIEHDFAEEVKHFDSQIEKLLDLKSSKSLIIETEDQKTTKDENLERKKTFDVFPVAQTSYHKSEKSQSHHQLETDSIDLAKSSSSSMSQKDDYDSWDSFEQKNENSEMRNTSHQYQIHSSKTELPVKITNNPPFEHHEYSSDKISIYSDEDHIFMKPSEVQPNKRRILVEDIPQKRRFAREDVNPTERVVKERSILSLALHLNKSQRKLSSETIDIVPFSEYDKKLHDTAMPGVILERIFHTKDLEANSSDMSAISRGTYDVIPESSVDADCSRRPTQDQIPVSSKLQPAPPSVDISTTTFQAVPLSKELRSSFTKTVKIQPDWERDIRQYRAIVKDIIEQYQRTKGFLKQNEALLDSLARPKLIQVHGKPSPPSNVGFLDINEYRRKIISEYKNLSIFEYKSKIQETSNSQEKKKERGLTVVKEVIPELDFDVKDFHPNIKKVLNSQIYVDQNRYYKLKCLRVKPAEQNPSLQEVMLGGSKVGIQHIKLNDQSKSQCIPKSNVSLPNSNVYSVLFHTPNHSKVEVDSDSMFDELMSLSEFDETEF